MTFLPLSRIVTDPDQIAHIDTWIFDLDNTLYHPRHCLFDQIDARMGAYIAQLEGCDLLTARTIQKRYFYDHGTTLAGLMAHHDVVPTHFLDYVHDIDVTVLDADPELRAALSVLPGRRLIYTNADTPYAQRVIERLGIADLFAGVFDICAAAFVPKPQPSAYDKFCTDHDIIPANAIFFEDMARNLIPAKKRGMTTVWLDNGAESGNRDIDPTAIDFITADLTAWLTTAINPQIIEAT